MQRTWLAGLALVVLAAALSAQQPGQQPQRPVFRAAVELIQVDVVVRDREGRPIRGLTVDDFVVLDRRKPQQIGQPQRRGHRGSIPAPGVDRSVQGYPRRPPADDRVHSSSFQRTWRRTSPASSGSPSRWECSRSKLGEWGSVYLPVDVPDFTRTPLAVSALVLGYAGGQRVPVVTSQPTNRGRTAGPGRGTGGGRGSGRGAPVPPEGLPFPPTLDREFKTTDDVALYFEVMRKDRARQIDASVAAVDGNDRVVRRYSQTLPASATGRVTFRVPLSELGPGAFRLRVTASDGINEGANEIGIVVK